MSVNTFICHFKYNRHSCITLAVGQTMNSEQSQRSFGNFKSSTERKECFPFPTSKHIVSLRLP